MDSPRNPRGDLHSPAVPGTGAGPINLELVDVGEGFSPEPPPNVVPPPDSPVRGAATNNSGGTGFARGLRAKALPYVSLVSPVLALCLWMYVGQLGGSAAGVPLHGKHVLIGIVDSGIDLHNSDFRNPNGTTRIAFLWDQTREGKPPPGYTTGYECDSSAINAGACPEKDTDGHGTYVAGIAAGNGRSGGGGAGAGPASQADLIVVKSNLDQDNVIAAWRYMVARAKGLGKPIVINTSFGDQNGPHDGSSPEARAMDALSGPGVIFVTAAGNDGHQGLHTTGAVAQGGTATVTVRGPAMLSELAFAVFYPARDEMTATLTQAKTGERFGPVEEGGRLETHPAGDSGIHVTVNATPWDSAHHSVLVDVYSLTAGESVSGTWRLTLGGTQVRDAIHYDAWLATGGQGTQTFAHATPSDTLAEPADAAATIAVGDYATRTGWTDRSGHRHQACDYTLCAGGKLHRGAIAYHSSEGPTADGRRKPDIAAPGVVISSTLSRDVPVCRHKASDPANCVDPIFITPDGKHLIDTGTSGASAYVAGVVADMLQADPSLTESRADSILRSTARHDRFTGKAAWTPAYGAGKINAAAAVRIATGLQGRY